MNRLKAICFELFSFMNIETKAGNRLYAQAIQFVGKDASPLNLVPKAVECAESVSFIIHSLWSNFPVITGTYTLLEALKSSNDFVEVSSPLPGDVVMYATGDGGGKNGITNGHTGIVGANNLVMSNNSLTGLFDTHFTVDSMRTRYRIIGGYKEHYFRRITN